MDAVQSEGEPYVVFQMAGAAYAVASAQVKHVEMVEYLTPVPNAHPFVAGAVFSRGEVVPVVDCRVRFGFTPKPPDLQSRLIVVAPSGRTVGLLVDTAREFRRLGSREILPPPEEMTRRSGRYLTGVAVVGDRLVFVLDVEKLLDFDGAERLEAIADEMQNLARTHPRDIVNEKASDDSGDAPTLKE